ncbi:MAG: hypothetical protein HKO57_00685 [Akkermansiaceae bacterium]|nr:hypothetical protein [Akkermansiaceae bacterium]
MNTIDERYQLHRYFGPNVRCGFAAIEIRFPDPGGGPVPWEDVCGLLELLGMPVDRHREQEDRPFPETLGRLAAILQHEPASKRTSGEDVDVAWVCLASRIPVVTQSAVVLAYQALLRLRSPDQKLLGALKQHLAVARRARPDRTTALIEAAAIRSNIPVYSVDPRLRIQQLGQGEAGRQFFEAGQDADSFTGHRVARDKLATIEYLARLGFPGPAQVGANDANQAVQAADRIGYPCVLKPLTGGKGIGITTGVAGPSEVAEAFMKAAKSGRGAVVVERELPGHDHRMAVFGGRLAWAYRRTPAQVTGDGRKTLRELVEEENASRPEEARRVGLVHEIKIDESLARFVRKQGLELETIVPDGREVRLCGPANLAQGGTLDDVTALVHPDNLAMAEDIAKAFRLEAMGLDFMTPDISKSWRDGHGGIIEVNGTPGLSGAADAWQVVHSRFPFRDRGRLPSVLVVGEDSATPAACVRLLENEGLSVAADIAGRTSVGGNELGGMAGKAGAVRAEALVLHPRTQAIVINAIHSDILQTGLPLDRFDLAIVSGNAGGDLDGIIAGACTQVVRPESGDEAAVREAVEACLARHRTDRSTIDELVGIPPGPPRVDGDGRAEAELTVWRLPCIPLGSLHSMIEEVLPDAEVEPLEANILTQELAPPLVNAWSRAILRSAGLPGGVVAEPGSAPAPHASQTPQRTFRLRSESGASEAFEVALRWSVATLDRLAAGYIRHGSLESCREANQSSTREALAALKQAAR